MKEQDYKYWRVRRLDTPISDVPSVAMVSLSDDNDSLDIVIEAPRDANRPRWVLRFINYPAYRNIPEEYRLGLWKHLDVSGQRCGHTFIVVNSPWLEALTASEDLLSVNFPELSHFVITTEDDVIEVLSPEPPEVRSLGPAPPGAKPAGKSEVFHSPEDGDAIDLLRYGKRGDA